MTLPEQVASKDGGWTAGQRAALEAACGERAVIWPRSGCISLRKIKTTADGRTHFIAPVADAFALFEAKLISSHGEITAAGRAALSLAQGDRT